MRSRCLRSPQLCLIGCDWAEDDFTVTAFLCIVNFAQPISPGEVITVTDIDTRQRHKLLLPKLTNDTNFEVTFKWVF